MWIRYSPQRNDGGITYDIIGEAITITMGDEQDTFDFTSMPDGEIETAETHLPHNPIISAKREDGVLWVELLRFHSDTATQDELFPTWQVVENVED